MGEKLNFVIIDDDSIFNFLSERLLTKSEVANNITAFSNAKEALSYFAESKENSPDIILLDIRMPEMTGFEFLDEFTRLNHLSTNIYMLSSSLDEKDRVKANTYTSVKGFLSKPLNKEIVNEIYTSRINQINPVSES
ncbi:MAG: response regulator [Bacteroidetes bacterium B1(2017)]|nr:MAG: response regulator [Bacteroidetes bacterium B1(2017)]